MHIKGFCIGTVAMELIFYLDTSIWIDLYEDRKGFNGEPLGDYAWDLLAFIMAQRHKVVISDELIRELLLRYPLEAINGMMKPFENLFIKVIFTAAQISEAKLLSKERLVPVSDALHAIIARGNGCIMIARDKHFLELDDISPHYKPEEIFI